MGKIPPQAKWLCLFLLAFFLPMQSHAQMRVWFGYTTGRLTYWPANLMISERDGYDKSPSKLDGFVVGSDFGNEHASGGFYFNNKGSVTTKEENGSISKYKIRINSYGFQVGGGVKNFKAGMTNEFAISYLAKKTGKEEEFGEAKWEPVFDKKREWNFGTGVYASFMLPIAEAMFLEVKPFYQGMWFTNRFFEGGSTIYTFKPDNLGVMFTIGFGGYLD